MAALTIDNKICLAGLRGTGNTHFCVAVLVNGLTGDATELKIVASQNPHNWSPVANTLKTVVTGGKTIVHRRFNATKIRPNPVTDAPEETGQVDITVSGNGGAQSPTVTVPVVYFDPISTTRRP